MDRLSKVLLVPAGIATLAGFGLGQMTNVLQPYWPDAPHWVFALLFWCGAALAFIPLPSWLIWLGWKNRRTFGRRWRMIIGLALVFGGCAMGVVGLSLIAGGDSPRASPVLSGTTPEPIKEAHQKAGPSSGDTQPNQPNQSEPPVTMEFIDSVRPTVEGNTVVGEPKGIIRGRNTTDMLVKNNFMIDRPTAPPPLLPQPTGEFSSFSNSELRNRVLEISAQLRDYQNKIDPQGASDEPIKAEFNEKYREACTSVLSEMVKRTGPIPIPSPTLPTQVNPKIMGDYRRLIRARSGSNAIFYGFVSSQSPGQVADFLDYMAEHLPS